MKRYINIICVVFAVFAATSCLDKFPETSLSPESFYSSEAELELGTNEFYEMLPEPDDNIFGSLQDNDFMYHISLTNIQNGSRSPENESWGKSTWSDLRHLNYYLAHSSNCKNAEVRARYDAVAYFFRAWFYYDKVRKYGDMPYYDYVISDVDKESLYKARQSRGYVMQKVMEDLDRAVAGLPEAWATNSVYRLSKNAALAFKSRVALFEGTWRKYHNVPDEQYSEGGRTLTLSANYFLGQAADAAFAVMEKNKYKMYTGTGTLLSGQPYREYFILPTAETDETIFARRYESNESVMVRHGIQFTLKNQRYSCTRALMYQYLMADGVPFTSKYNKDKYSKMEYAESFKDRDPRMAQSLASFDYVPLGSPEVEVETCGDYDLSGYRPIKYFSSSAFDGAGTSVTDYAIFRYAEVLLNYAEAKAEIGTLTSNDVKMTVDVIRERVNMPALNMDEANSSPDEYLSSYYPNVTGTNKGVILEIRRERAVELLNEGHRMWDLFRWNCGKHMCPASSGTGQAEADGSERFRGMYVPALEKADEAGNVWHECDMNGDGSGDLCVYIGKKPKCKCDNYLNVSPGESQSLTNGKNGGWLEHYADQTYNWNEIRDYLYPIPVSQQQLYPYGPGGPTLTQNPGY